jgi:hypothetical protein
VFFNIQIVELFICLRTALGVVVTFIFSAAILIAIADALALTLHPEMLSVCAPFTNADECPFFFPELILEIWDSNLAKDD